MAETLDPKDVASPEELAISNMSEVAAIVELLEHNGLLPKGKSCPWSMMSTRKLGGDRKGSYVNQ